MARPIDLLDVHTRFDENVDGLFMVHEQEVTDDLLTSIRHARIDSVRERARDYHMTASIPTSVIDIWIGQGRDFWNASSREVVKWLQQDGLDAFVATNKRV